MTSGDPEALFDRIEALGWRSFRVFLDRLAVQVERDLGRKRATAGLRSRPRQQSREHLPLFDRG